MFFPFGDYPNPSKPQWVTRILIGINIAVYFFITVPLERKPVSPDDLKKPKIASQVAAIWEWEGPLRQKQYEKLWRDERIRAIPSPEEQYRAFLTELTHYSLFVDEWGYKPGEANLVDLLFCMFLHGGLLHMAFNMLYLWIFGDNVEWRIGPVGYLLTYLGTGVVATMSFAAFEAGSLTPLVGASGAISGVLGLYLIWFPHNQIRVLLFFWLIMVVHIRAVWVLVSYLVIDNLLPMLANVEDNVARGAHIGGFVGGVVVAWMMNRIRGVVPAPRPVPFVARGRQGWRGPPIRQPVYRVAEDAVEVFSRAMRAGNMEEAAHAFSRVVREGGSPDEGEVFGLARWLYESEFTPDAAAVFRYYIRKYPRGSDLDRVHLGLGILLARRLGQATAAREHLLQALDLADPASPIAANAKAELENLDVR